MASKIEKSIIVLDKVTAGGARGRIAIDPRAQILAAVIYLCLMLGVPTTHIDILLWFAVYPIIASPLFGITYTSLFLKSLIVLPLVLLLGMFNPIVDKTPVATFDGVTITNGWLLFCGIIVRGLLSMQVLLMLVLSIGFVGIVRGMSRLGLPRFLVTQLLMVFRYIKVLIEEALTMKQARDARSFGNSHLSIRLWGVLIGQLFLRSVDRSERVHRAMLARGFEGEIPFYNEADGRWHWNDTIYLVVWTGVFVFLRICNLSLLFVSR